MSTYYLTGDIEDRQLLNTFHTYIELLIYLNHPSYHCCQGLQQRKLLREAYAALHNRALIASTDSSAYYSQHTSETVINSYPSS